MKNLLMLSLFVILTGCATTRTNEKGTPLEGIWKLNHIECFGARLTQEGTYLNEKLKEGSETLVIRYDANSEMSLFGRSAFNRANYTDFCELQGKLVWKQQKIPGQCEFNEKVVMRGKVRTEVCKSAFPADLLLCATRSYEVDDKQLKLRLPQFDHERLAAQKLCSEKDLHLFFDRVL